MFDKSPSSARPIAIMLRERNSSMYIESRPARTIHTCLAIPRVYRRIIPFFAVCCTLARLLVRRAFPAPIEEGIKFENRPLEADPRWTDGQCLSPTRPDTPDRRVNRRWTDGEPAVTEADKPDTRPASQPAVDRRVTRQSRKLPYCRQYTYDGAEIRAAYTVSDSVAVRRELPVAL